MGAIRHHILATTAFLFIQNMDLTMTFHHNQITFSGFYRI